MSIVTVKRSSNHGQIKVPPAAMLGAYFDDETGTRVNFRDNFGREVDTFSFPIGGIVVFNTDNANDEHNLAAITRLVNQGRLSFPIQIISDDDEVKKASEMRQKRREADALVIKLHQENPRLLGRLYRRLGFGSPTSMPIDRIKARMEELAEKDPHRLISVYSDQNKDVAFIFDEAVEAGIVKRIKDQFVYGQTSLGVAEDVAIIYLIANPDMKNALLGQLTAQGIIKEEKPVDTAKGRSNMKDKGVINLSEIEIDDNVPAFAVTEEDIQFCVTSGILRKDKGTEMYIFGANAVIGRTVPDVVNMLNNKNNELLLKKINKMIVVRKTELTLT